MSSLTKYICIDQKCFGDKRDFVDTKVFYEMVIYDNWRLLYLRLDAFKWITDNFGFHSWNVIQSTTKPKLVFDNEEDAVAFKLRWE